MTLAVGVSFLDDIHSMPNSVLMVAQFVAMTLEFYQLDYSFEYVVGGNFGSV